MSHLIEGLVFCYRKNLDYGQKLVADLSQDQMCRPPVAGLEVPANHPAWVFSHLNVYLPIIESLILGETFPDPIDHPFGMKSKPEDDPSIYPAKEALLATFVGKHERILELLSQADDSLFAQPVTLTRWQPNMPVLGIALPYLMILHECTHLGQVSAWRRVHGLPMV